MFIKVSDTEKQVFTEWACENRKSINSVLTEDGKILAMLEYWYTHADADEKAQIITWIITQ